MMNTTADMIADSPAGIHLTNCRYGILQGNRLCHIEEWEGYSDSAR